MSMTPFQAYSVVGHYVSPSRSEVQGSDFSTAAQTHENLSQRHRPSISLRVFGELSSRRCGVDYVLSREVYEAFRFVLALAGMIGFVVLATYGGGRRE